MNTILSVLSTLYLVLTNVDFKQFLVVNVQTHLTEECPLQSVGCEFKWAGYQYTSLHNNTITIVN